MPLLKNEYYTITDPSTVYAFVGIVDSNSYVGASKALGNLYAELVLQPGDEIHDLSGGVFAVLTSGETFKVRVNLEHLPNVYEHRNIPLPVPTPPGVLIDTPALTGAYAEANNYRGEGIIPMADARNRAVSLSNHMDWLSTTPVTV